MNLPIRQNFATSACVFIRKTSLSAVHLSYSAPMHILVLLYFAELSCLCNFLVESVNVIFRPRFCILYSSCHRHWIVSLVIFGIVYAHVQFTLGNFNTLDSIFAHVHQTFFFINKQFHTCANAFLNKFTVRSCEYYTYQQ